MQEIKTNVKVYIFIYFFLQRFYGEKQQRLPSNSKQIDLTQRRLIRSSSMVGEIGNINVSSNWCSFVPSIERSCSLPIDSEKKIMLLDMQRSLATSEIHGNCFFIH
jgi:hypothetical protein